MKWNVKNLYFSDEVRTIESFFHLTWKYFQLNRDKCFFPRSSCFYSNVVYEMCWTFLTVYCRHCVYLRIFFPLRLDLFVLKSGNLWPDIWWRMSVMSMLRVFLLSLTHLVSELFGSQRPNAVESICIQTKCIQSDCIWNFDPLKVRQSL